jgi:hypothetical protein
MHKNCSRGKVAASGGAPIQEIEVHNGSLRSLAHLYVLMSSSMTKPSSKPSPSSFAPATVTL